MTVEIVPGAEGEAQGSCSCSIVALAVVVVARVQRHKVKNARPLLRPPSTTLSPSAGQQLPFRLSAQARVASPFGLFRQIASTLSQLSLRRALSFASNVFASI